MNNTDKKLTVAVIFGGKTPEHEVSIITGVQVLKSIDKEKYNILPIYVSKQGFMFTSDSFYTIETFKDLTHIPYSAHEVLLKPSDNKGVAKITKRGLFSKSSDTVIDVMFPCIHGGQGENGAYQGLFESCNIPYVGSGVLGSALGMNKLVAKYIYKDIGVKSADYMHFYSNEISQSVQEVISKVEGKFTYPVFVKPADSGSSIGVNKANNSKELSNALEVAASFSLGVLVEEAITDAQEINISVVGISGKELKTSVCEEVFAKGEFLSYDAKYKGNGNKSEGMVSTKRQIPANLSNSIRQDIEKSAKKVFQSLHLHGLARIDFLVKKQTGDIYVIEPNTTPGSMAFYLWEASGVTFTKLIDNLIELALERHKMDSSVISSIDSNILRDFKPGLKNSKLG